MIASFLLQAFLLFVLIVLPREVQRLRPYAAPRIQSEDVIYYSADELPRTQDLGGASSGTSGRAGGRQAHHRTQTIHVARGAALAQQVVDAPNLKLPVSSGAVANLLKFKSVRPIPGLSSAEGLHSSLSSPNLPAKVIAPPGDVPREQSRGGFTAAGAKCLVEPFAVRARAQFGDCSACSQCAIRTHAVRAEAGCQHHRARAEHQSVS
jgi:hypothetical protein